MRDGLDRSMTDEQAVLLRRPSPGCELPLVYDSPHSGRHYPADFMPLAPVERLHGYEDRLVDELLLDAPDAGILLIAANFPRAYVDPNRAIDDLDPQIVGDDWKDPLRPTPYSELGLGLIFRVGLDLQPIYERPLGRETVSRRIENYWRPYHDSLERELSRAQEHWGAVWHVAWHSMRPLGDSQAPDPGASRPDFVVSDRDGTSAEADFTRFAVNALRSLGHSVSVNHPFKGGYITQLHGRPHEGRHSLQIEINRALYLDLETLQLLPDSAALRRRLAAFSRRLADFVSSRLPEGAPKAS